MTGEAEYVTFELAGGRYAVPMSRVREIIPMPAVVRVPLGPPGLLGLANRRGRVLPVVSLRSCCGLPAAEPDRAGRVIVVEGGVPLGLVVDRATGVLTVEESELVPAASMRSAVRDDVLLGVLPLGGSQDEGTVITVLDVDRLVGAQFPRPARTAGTKEAATIVGERREGAPDAGDEESFVVFRLDDGEYAVDIDAVQEVIRRPDRLIRVPSSHDFVEGLVSVRGAVLPVVDLRTRLGLPRAERDDRQRIVVLTVGQARAGVIVDSVAEVARVGRHVLEPAPELSPGQARVVSRVANLPDQRRMLLLVRADELLPADLAEVAV